MGYLNSISGLQADGAPVSGGGLRSRSFIPCEVVLRLTIFFSRFVYVSYLCDFRADLMLAFASYVLSSNSKTN